MIRKKSGASLVSVVILSGIVITMGTAMLTLTVGDYKARMNESARIKNLYSSESGLDYAQDILGKTFDAGVKYAVQKVDENIKNTGFVTSLKDELQVLQAERKQISESTDFDKKEQLVQKSMEIDELSKKIKIEEDKAIDTYFKKNFNDFVYMDEFQKEYETKLINEVNRDELRKCLIGKKYIEDITKTEEVDRYSAVNFDSNSKDIELVVDKVDKGDNKGIEFADLAAESANKYNTRKYTITITSTYFTEDKNGKNERKLQSVYNMTVPDYKDVAFSESNVKLANYSFLNDKALIVGKNMNVTSTLSVNGNVFVQGFEEQATNGYSRVYDKYKGGIVLDSTSERNVVFTGDVVTGKTFNLKSKMDATIQGNLYAMNVYADGNTQNASTYSSKLNVIKIGSDGGQVVVDNDIALKANKTQITMDKFYGLNDKNLEYKENEEVNISTQPKERTSSSIIVNAHDKDSFIKVSEQAFIMGVAHIDTKTYEGYTTGESTGVKGNYIAYAYPSGDIDEKFDYYDPLQLLDENNIIKKSEHFVNYWKDKPSSVDTGGIELPEEGEVDGLPSINSIGAIVYKNSKGETKVVNSSYSIAGHDAVKVKRREFATKVYNLEGRVLEDEDKNYLYESLGVSKDDQVSYIMAINNTISDYKEINRMFFKEFGDIGDTPNEENNAEKAIFSDKNIKIQSSSTNKIEQDGNDSIIINVSDSKINGVIATSGNVTITGDIDFEGSIIADGDVNIIGVEENTLKYNKDLVNRIVASNSEVFSSVFGHVNQDYNNSEQQSSVANATIDYDRGKFVKDKIWKIVK